MNRRGLRRPNSRSLGGGAAAPAALALNGPSTFTRSTEASYLTSASTLAWAAVNVARFDSRGDAFALANPLTYFTEGSRTNTLLRSEEFSNATWVKGGSATVSANTDVAPDGDADADTLVFTASASDYVSQIASVVPANAARGVFTVWLRAAAPQTVRLRLLQKDASTYGASVDCAVTTTWQRFELNQAVGTGVVAPTLEIWNYTDAAARDVFAWGAQFECSAATVQSPSSYIRTAATAVTRGVDILSFSTAQYLAAIRTNGFVLPFAPDRSSAENAASTADSTMDLFSMGTVTNGGTTLDSQTAGVYRPGVGWLFEAATWSRSQALTITVRPAVSRTLAGFSTGNGLDALSGTAWLSDSLSVGQRGGAGTTSFYGRIASPIAVL